MDIKELEKLIDARAAVKFAEEAEKVKKPEEVTKAVTEPVETAETKAVAQITAVSNEDELRNAAQEEADSKNWKSFGEFCQKLWSFRMGHTPVPDNRLLFIDKSGVPQVPKRLTKAEELSALNKTMTVGTDSSGGFLVPGAFKADVLQIGLEKEIFRSNGATVIAMDTDTIDIPRVDDSSHASSVFGGVIAYWTKEAATMTATDIKWGDVTLKANNLTGYTIASNNLLADSAIALETFIKRAFSEAWAYYQDDAYLNGTGSGQPLGILNSPCLISVTRQANSKVLYNDLVNLYSQMLPTSRARGVWMLNHEVLPQLMEMGAGNVTQASGHNLVWINPVMGAEQPIPGRIFGRPFVVTEKMAALGSAGDIGFFDLSYYLIGDRSSLAIDASSHVYFTSNKTAWRFVLRVDGQPWPSTALTPKNGTATLSPFTALSSSS